MKPFSHFTLGCSLEDEAPHITSAFNELSNFLKGPLMLHGKSVVNLGNEQQPLWGITLDLDTEETTLRKLFSDLFDPIMCPDRGTIYSWSATEESEKRCAHITVGPGEDNYRTACLLQDCQFTFSSLDYKKVGPHDPHVSLSLVKG